MNQAHRILIIEDDKYILNLIDLLAREEGYRTFLASTGHFALTLYSAQTPDIVILDLGLPDLDGFDIIRKIRETDSTPILIVSAMGDESQKIEALDLGADDYITKPFHTGELLARIRVIERRLKLMETEPPSRKLTIEYMTIDLEQGLLWIDGSEVHLTLIEFKLLRLLVLNRGKVLTYNFIMKNVWGHGEFADANNLRVCMASLRKKIEKDTANPNFILTQVGIGYRFISI